MKDLCGAKRMEHLVYFPDIDIVYTCDRPVGHKENHRHHITKTEYLSWPQEMKRGSGYEGPFEIP